MASQQSITLTLNYGFELVMISPIQDVEQHVELPAQQLPLLESAVPKSDGMDEGCETSVVLDEGFVKGLIGVCFPNAVASNQAGEEYKRIVEEVVDTHDAEQITSDNTSADTGSPTEPFQCTLCDKKCKSKYGLTLHFDSIHGGASKTIQCRVCRKKFSDKEAMENHQHKHSMESKPHKCEQCPKQYMYIQDLRRHINVKHSDQNKFRCGFCGRNFDRGCHLTRHINSKHKKVTNNVESKK